MKPVQRTFLGFLFLSFLTLPAYGREAKEPRSSIVAVSKLPTASIQQRLDEHFYRWETYELDLRSLEQQARLEQRIDLYLGNRRLQIDLELNNLRAPGYKRVVHTRSGPVQLPPAPVATYRGRLRNDPASEVRLLIQPGFLQGFIMTADDLLFIEPLTKYGKGEPASAVVIFDNADVKPSAALTCGLGEIAHQAGLLGENVPEDTSPLSSVFEEATLTTTTLREVDLATDADYDYYLKYPSNTHAQIEGILNMADFYFRRDLGVTINLRYQNVWTSTAPPYPYTSTDPDILISQFADYWNTYVTTPRDIAHLFTNKQSGGVAGLAFWPPSTCVNPSLAYSISWDVMPAVVAAHEIGHNLGADHDPDSICPLDPGTGPIMCRYLQNNGSRRFSSNSQNQIRSFINSSGSCLASIQLRSIFTTQTPAQVLDTGGVSYEVGTQFSSSSSGYVVALRFWKAAGETGQHIATLWTNSGQKLAEVLFENETSSGWQEMHLSTPVYISSGVLYRVTFNTNTKQAKTGCGLQGGVTNGTLTAWQGFWISGGGIFPTNASCSNFFADIYFYPASSRRRAVRH